MATALRSISHEDRLSVVDHLDELRTRLIVSAIAFVIAFGLAFWQNGRLLDILNKPLKESTPSAQSSGNGRLATVGAAETEARTGVIKQARAEDLLARDPRATSYQRHAHALAAAGLRQQAAALPATVPQRRPITIGVGEPFVTTFTVAVYFALMFSLPILLYQAYAFILPAFSPTERRLAFPLMLGIPFLFIAGVVFGYFLVLPPAISFLQNFNNKSFDVLLQAKQYYSFSIFTLLALGLCFQVPVGMLALARVGIVTKRMLIKNWRYEIVGIAVAAALLPGVDPVTTLLEMIPLVVLFGLSIVLVGLAERRRGTPEDDDEPVLPDLDD